jgi:hypothetical protein
MPRRTPMTEALPTTFHVGSKTLDYQEETMLPLHKGDGVMFGEGPRYRVVDTWVSYDHHGHFGEGLHVFLEPVEAFGPDDTLGNAAPDYFRHG